MQTIIKEKKGFSAINFHELLNCRELFYFLSWRDIKLRYKQTIFGIGWAVLQPFLMMVVFSVFFSRVVGSQSGVPYPIFSFAGLLFWNIFSEGRVLLTISLATFDGMPLDHVTAHSVVSFKVIDTFESDGARANIYSNCSGVVNPKLSWSSEIIN